MFCWVTIHVKNLEESLRFYEDIVGLEVNQKFDAGPKTKIAFLGDGETKIELIYNEDNKDLKQSDNISLGFKVSSIKEKINILNNNNIEVLGEIIQPNPEVKFFFVQDPNGLKIQFVEDVK